MENSVTRQVDSIGRITIPNDLRSQVGMEIGLEVEISVDGDRLWLKVSVPRCVFCKSEVLPEDVQIWDKFMCRTCAAVVRG